jgi:hypothetical protein
MERDSVLPVHPGGVQLAEIVRGAEGEGPSEDQRARADLLLGRDGGVDEVRVLARGSLQ